MSNATILLVDDEKSVLDSLKQQLRRHYGHRFSYETAETASDAIEIVDELQAEGRRIVVVVSDWLMPGMRGDEFLALVRRRHPGIVRVLLTGQADKAALERARKDAAVSGLLFKPWQLEDLAAIIAAELGDDF